MDDLKRAIYMLALEKISKEEEKLVCIALCKTLAEITGGSPLSLKDAKELLPEFHSLYDRKQWYKYGNSIKFFYEPGNYAAWWKFGWKEPRVRILNCILCQH